MKKYTDLDALLADMRNMEASLSAADAMREMCGVYLERDNGELLRNDPFSPEYHSAAKALYEEISGVRGYQPEVNELAPPVDAAQGAACPSPYNFRESRTVGDFFSAWGWIFQVLDVKAGDRILEYGPGEGQLSIMLARMGCDVSVIDINENYLESIRAQCRNLGISIRTRCARFGEGFGDEKFDRILFFESFHHSLEHQQLVRTLKTQLAARGSVVFSGEPIVSATSREALFVPFPWGPRLDGLSVRSSNRFGWCELGFQEGYFAELLMRSGWLVSRHLCPVTGRGHCYKAVPNNGRIELGSALVLDRHKGDAGWYEGEGTHRWTRGTAYLTLPVDWAGSERSATVELANFLPVTKQVTIRADGASKSIRMDSGERTSVTLPVASSVRYLEILAESSLLASLRSRVTDRRRLGIAVVSVTLR